MPIKCRSHVFSAAGVNARIFQSRNAVRFAHASIFRLPLLGSVMLAWWQMPLLGQYYAAILDGAALAVIAQNAAARMMKDVVFMVVSPFQAALRNVSA